VTDLEAALVAGLAAIDLAAIGFAVAGFAAAGAGFAGLTGAGEAARSSGSVAIRQRLRTNFINRSPGMKIIMPAGAAQRQAFRQNANPIGALMWCGASPAGPIL